MEFLELAKSRYSVRNYKDTPIEEEKLAAIIEAGRVAPTAKNSQPQRIYVLKSEEALAQIRALTRCAFNAPVVFMIAYEASEEFGDRLVEGISSGEQDVSIVATHMMLEAWELGIGSCWVNAFPNSDAARAFNLPESEKVVLLMPMGYPADGSEPSPMHSQSKDISEFVKTL